MSLRALAVTAAICLGLVTSSAFGQQTLYVDDDAPNDPGPNDPAVSDPLEDGSETHPYDGVQEAIDVAEDGDTVLVRPGLHAVGEPVHFNPIRQFGDVIATNPKNLVLRSEQGPEGTVIRMAESPKDPNVASVLFFASGEDESSVVEGFTLAGGQGTVEFFAVYLDASGGHVDCFVCPAGEAVYISGSSPTVRNCILTGDLAVPQRAFAKIFCLGGTPRFVDCVVDAVSDATPSPASDAAVFAESSDITLERCRISATAVGVHVQTASAVLRECTVSGAFQGVVCVAIGRSSCTLTECLIAGNSTALELRGEMRATVLNSTFSVHENALKASDGGSFVVKNSILWDNALSAIELDGTSSATVSNSCVEGGSVWPGVGNINDDPLFCRVGHWEDRSWVEGDYRLSRGSPCIGSGENGANMGADLGFCDTRFRRGDADSGGGLDITDAVVLLHFLFSSADRLPCLDAADADDNGSLEITDGIFVLNFLFLEGPAPSEPFPTCGPDRTEDGLACGLYLHCRPQRPPE